MIATKLIIQSILGIGAIAGVAGSSYMLMGSSDEYFLVTSVKETNTSNQPSLDLWTAKKTTSLAQSSSVEAPAEEKTEKNYQCQQAEENNKNIDKTCEIYSISYETSKNTIDLTKLTEKIDSTKLVKEKTTLVDKKFFLLKASSTFYKDWNLNDTKEQTIKLMSTKKGEEIKFYATLTVHAKVNGNNVIGKTDMAIVKLNGTSDLTTPTNSQTYKCKFKDTKEAATEVCTINTFTTPTLDNAKTLHDLSWSAFTIPSTPATPPTIVADNYYVIKWVNKSIADLNTKQVIIVEDNAQPTKTATFDIKSPIFGIFETNNKEGILLKTQK